MTLDDLNRAPADDARQAFLQCCGSSKWAERMAGSRPFGTPDQLFRAADEADRLLADDDWLEAFSAHPRIGERSSSEWSQREQAAALKAEDVVKQEISRLNKEYDQKFGFIFIVFASGKSPDEIVKIMEARIRNDRATEIGNAAAEQQKITRARLRKLVGL